MQITKSSAIYEILWFLPYREQLKLQSINKRFYNVYIPIVTQQKRCLLVDLKNEFRLTQYFESSSDMMTAIKYQDSIQTLGQINQYQSNLRRHSSIDPYFDLQPHQYQIVLKTKGRSLLIDTRELTITESTTLPDFDDIFKGETTMKGQQLIDKLRYIPEIYCFYDCQFAVLTMNSQTPRVIILNGPQMY